MAVTISELARNNSYHFYGFGIFACLRQFYACFSRFSPVPRGINGGVDITITTNETKSGEFYNIGTFTVNSGVTLTVGGE